MAIYRNNKEIAGVGAQGPKGDTGDTGAQGPKGDTGAQGPKGDTGDTGAQGPKGDTGDTGAQGPKGDTGAQGPKGDTGAQGPKGDTGAQGPKGDTGDIPKALMSNGTTATTTPGTIYGVPGVTSSPYSYAKWYANLDDSEVALTDGMVVAIKIPVNGCKYGTCISIDNGQNFHPVVYSTNSLLATQFSVGTELLLMYGSNSSASVYDNSTTATSIQGVWRVMNLYDSGNTVAQCYCSSSGSSSAKSASCTSYVARANTYLLVTIGSSNTSKTALTLNINNQGAKPIYINGEASSSSNYTINNGVYLVFYDGTNYYFRTDGKITGNITGDASTVNGHTVETDVPPNAKFTGTISGVTMNGTSKGTSGVVDLGTVLTGIFLNGLGYGSTDGVVNLGNAVVSITINGIEYDPTDGLVDLGTVITPSDVVSTTADGIMTKEDKSTLDTVATAISNKVNKDGDTMSSSLSISSDVARDGFYLKNSNGVVVGYVSNYTVGTEAIEGQCCITLGNNKAKGTNGNSTGKAYLYGDTNKYVAIQPPSGLTTNPVFTLPKASGTLARLQDMVGVWTLRRTSAGTMKFTIKTPCYCNGTTRTLMAGLRFIVQGCKTTSSSTYSIGEYVLISSTISGNPSWILPGGTTGSAPQITVECSDTSSELTGIQDLTFTVTFTGKAYSFVTCYYDGYYQTVS